MIERRWFVGFLTGGAMALLGGCGSSSEASYRFRMTVEVNTPQGLRTGSSVIEVILNRAMAIGDRSGVSSQVRGEAVVVELPDGPLFVLLTIPDAGPPLQSIVPHALLGRHSSGPDEVMDDTAKIGSTLFKEYKAELPRRRETGCVASQNCSDNNWPLMVRFRDLSDPTSVERVDPEVVGVKRIIVETTSDRVTTGIVERLPWLTDSGLTLDPNGRPSINPSFAGTIYQREFTTELER